MPLQRIPRRPNWGEEANMRGHFPFKMRSSLKRFEMYTVTSLKTSRISNCAHSPLTRLGAGTGLLCGGVRPGSRTRPQAGGGGRGGTGPRNPHPQLEGATVCEALCWARTV